MVHNKRMMARSLNDNLKSVLDKKQPTKVENGIREVMREST